MDDYGLDLHSQMLLGEYRERLELFRQLRQIVIDKMGSSISQSGIELNTTESRIKTEASLAGKLHRKGSKYQSIADITDIVGVRIIAFYNEDVDRIASMTEKLFKVDWANSVDKRKMHQVNSFGYNSLHYICRLPRELFYDANHPELNEIPFELQMRTALQHVWSAIQHDIGYKTDIETPAEYHRNLSRLAGLLELADNEFSRIRTSIADYRRRILLLVKSGKFDEAPLDGDTFHTYLAQRPFDQLNRRIAAITQAELMPVTAMPYLGVLRMMGMETLADVERMIREQQNDAYQLALFQLGSTDIDILADTIGLQNLCIVTILKKGEGQKGLTRMLELVNGPSPHNDDMAAMLVEQASRLSFMHV